MLFCKISISFEIKVRYELFDRVSNQIDLYTDFNKGVPSLENFESGIKSQIDKMILSAHHVILSVLKSATLQERKVLYRNQRKAYGGHKQPVYADWYRTFFE